MKLKFGNDFGNSSIKLGVNDTIISQPSVFCKVASLDNLEELNSEYVLSNLYDNLVCTIESKALGTLPCTYYVGNYALTSGNYLTNIGVGGLNNKAGSSVSVVCSLAFMAAYAVKETLDTDPCADEIDLDAEMATAIPVSQYSKTVAKEYANRFMGSHKVIVYLGSRKVTVNVNIPYAYVLPEGIPSMYYLTGKHAIAELKGYDFKSSKVQHVSIGEGTTEYPQTFDGVRFDPRFNFGDNSGVGKAAENVLDKFIAQINLEKYSRQQLMNVVRNPQHKFHDIAMPLFEMALEEQAQVILKNIRKQLEKCDFEVDYVLIYGGGSVLMRKFLDNALTAYAEQRGIKVVFVPEEHAITLEANGLNSFVHSKVYTALKSAELKK